MCLSEPKGAGAPQALIIIPDLEQESDFVPSPPPPPYDQHDTIIVSDDEVSYMTAQHEKTLLARHIARHYNSDIRRAPEPDLGSLPMKSDAAQHVPPQPQSPPPQVDAYSRATTWRDFTLALDSLNQFAETPGPSWFMANHSTDLATIHARISILTKFLREGFSGGEDETAALQSQVSQLTEVAGAQASEIERLEQEIERLRAQSSAPTNPSAAPIVQSDGPATSSPPHVPSCIETNIHDPVLEATRHKADDAADGSAIRQNPDPCPTASLLSSSRRSSESSVSPTQPTLSTRRLILDVVCPPPQRPPGSYAVKVANDRLRELTGDATIRISTVCYSRNGRPVVTTCDNVSPETLVPFADIIYASVFGHSARQKVHAYPDLPRHRVKLNGVPTKLPDGKDLTPEAVLTQLQLGPKAHKMDNGVIPKSALACPPTWLIPLHRLRRESKTHSTVVLSFVSAEHARRFCAHKALTMFGKRCWTSPFTKHPPPPPPRHVPSSMSLHAPKVPPLRIPSESGSSSTESAGELTESLNEARNIHGSSRRTASTVPPQRGRKSRTRQQTLRVPSESSTSGAITHSNAGQ